MSFNVPWSELKTVAMFVINMHDSSYSSNVLSSEYVHWTSGILSVEVELDPASVMLSVTSAYIRQWWQITAMTMSHVHYKCQASEEQCEISIHMEGIARPTMISNQYLKESKKSPSVRPAFQ